MSSSEFIFDWENPEDTLLSGTSNFGINEIVELKRNALCVVAATNTINQKILKFSEII